MPGHVHRRDDVAGRDPPEGVDDRDVLGRVHRADVGPDPAHRLPRRQEIRVAFVAVGKRLETIHAGIRGDPAYPMPSIAAPAIMVSMT